MFHKIDKTLLRVTTAVSIVSYIGFLFIMALTVADVALRKITGVGITGTMELVERTLMCSVFAGFAYTQSLGGHVHVTMLIMHFPAKLRFVCYGVMGMLSTLIAAALGYAGITQAQYSHMAATRTGVLGIPLYPFFIVEGICMICFAIALLWDVIKSFMAIGNAELAAEIQSEWS